MREWVKELAEKTTYVDSSVGLYDDSWRSQATDESGCVVAGVGPEAPTVINEKGAKQSSSPYRCDLLPGAAILHLSHIFKYGAEKYGDNNWRGIKEMDHINHALVHVLAYLAGDKQDDHLGHAAWRMLAALETKLTGGENAPKS